MADHQQLRARDVLRLLLWKNWIRHKREPTQTAVAISTVIALCSVFVVMRYLNPPEGLRHAVQFKSYSPAYIPQGRVPDLDTIFKNPRKGAIADGICRFWQKGDVINKKTFTKLPTLLNANVNVDSLNLKHPQLISAMASLNYSKVQKYIPKDLNWRFLLDLLDDDDLEQLSDLILNHDTMDWPEFLEKNKGAFISAFIDIFERRKSDFTGLLKQILQEPENKRWIVLWSPDNNLTQSIMEDAMNITPFIGCGLENSSTLLNLMTRSPGASFQDVVTLAAVIFPDDMKTADSLPENLNVTLRFPGQTRYRWNKVAREPQEVGKSGPPSPWFTMHVFPWLVFNEPADPLNVQGEISPGYLFEGFLGLQEAVSRAVVQWHNKSSGGKIPPIAVHLKRFPDPSRFVDTHMALFSCVLLLVVSSSIMFVVAAATRAYVAEKEIQFTEALKMTGANASLNGLAWFVDNIVMFGICAVIMAIAMTMPIAGTTVLPTSNFFCVLLLIFLYAMSAISVSYLASSMFHTASSAAVGGNAFWFVFLCVFSWLETSEPVVPFRRRLLSGISPVAAVCYAIKTILTFEGVGTGLQWNNIWSRLLGTEDVPVAYSMITLTVDTVLIWLLGLYIEMINPGPSGIPLPWHFPISKFFRQIEDPTVSIKPTKNEFLIEEPEPQNLRVGIEFKNLRKVYQNGVVAVHDLSLKVFEGQITVLLGHNGAGKTTTLSMLAGLMKPSSGSVFLAGNDISSSLNKTRRELGYCPQTNILLNHLTVGEHLIMFARLKGVSKENLQREVSKYAKMMLLHDKMDVFSKNLSGGWKRKLSIALALIGDSQVVVLDEPTSGIDADARRSLWDVLQKEKTHRTILLTTHYMDEADLLGDRIVILSAGHLHCVGSSFYIKSHLCGGYRLVLVKGPFASSKEIKETIKRTIPDCELVSDLGAELAFQIPNQRQSDIPKVLDWIEKEKSHIGVTSYGLASANLEDVIMTVVGGGKNKLRQIRFDPVENISHKPVTNISLVLTQIWALLGNRWYTAVRNPAVTAWLTLNPALIVAVSVYISQLWQGTKDQSPRPFTMQDYVGGYGVLESTQPGLLEEFSSTVGAAIYNVSSIDTFFLHKSREEPLATHRRFILGLAADEGQWTGVYNSKGFHTAPFALQTVYNTMLHTYLNSSINVNFINHPLPYSGFMKSMIQHLGPNVSTQIGGPACTTFYFICAWLIGRYVTERSTRSKLLQMTTGLSPMTYWLTSLFADLLLVTISTVLFTATLFSYQEDGYSTAADIGRILVIILSFAFSTLSVGTLVSLLAEDGAIIQLHINIFLHFGGIIPFNVIGVMKAFNTISVSTWEWLGMIFRWIPSYAMTEAVINLSTIHWLFNFCDSVYHNQCIEDPTFIHPCCKVANQCPNNKCLNWVERYFDMTYPGIGKNILSMWTIGCASLLLLLLIELRYLSNISHWFAGKCKSLRTGKEDEQVNPDSKLPSPDDSNYNVISRGLSKKYGDNWVVQKLSFAIKKGECFGLLGINGAGKTTTFKMLTGDIAPSAGDAFIQGCSVVTDKSKIYCRFGYCPQFDAVVEDLTGRETLRFFCRLRGIPSTQVEMTCERMAHQLFFYPHIDKQVKEYSGGNKRKLSTAVALVGNPAVLYLDEPTSGMDTLAKRYFWDVICKVRDSGKTVLLTSHSLEESEALCTRVAVIKAGELLSVGSPQELKTAFSRKFILTVKLRLPVGGSSKKQQMVHTITETVQKQFAKRLPGAVLIREQIGLLTYHIPKAGGLSWPTIFSAALESKHERLIEDFTLDQSSLEEVFLTLATSTSSSKTD